MVLVQFSKDRLGIESSKLLLVPDKRLSFISLENCGEDREKVLLFQCEEVLVILRGRDVVWIDDVIQILCLGSCDELKVPGSPVTFVIEALELTRLPFH